MKQRWRARADQALGSRGKLFQKAVYDCSLLREGAPAVAAILLLRPTKPRFAHIASTPRASPQLDPAQIALNADAAPSTPLQPKRIDDPARLFPPDLAVPVFELFQFEVERRDRAREGDERGVLGFQGRDEGGRREGVRGRREERGDLLRGGGGGWWLVTPLEELSTSEPK